MGIGIREFKAHLSKHLAEVRTGKSLTITDHGKPVARVVPLEGASVVDRLIAEGRITPAKEAGGPIDEPLDIGSSVSDLIDDQRR